MEGAIGGAGRAAALSTRGQRQAQGRVVPKGDRSGRARSDWTAPRLQLLNPKSQSGGARERARGTAAAAAAARVQRGRA